MHESHEYEFFDDDYSYFSNDSDHPRKHEDHDAHVFYSGDLSYIQRDLFYLCSVFIIGAMVRHATDLLHIPVPYTVIIFFFGVVVGYLPLSQVIFLGPHTILYVFMPVLIFEGAFAIDVYIFKQIILQVLVLAGPALVVMVTLTAGMSMYMFKYPEWDWTIAFLFGSILTATDPVAVVAIMKELGTSKRLGLLIEGESMLNDGTAMVVYEIFKNLVEDPNMSVTRALVSVVWISVGGPIFGYLMAKLAIFWLQWTFNDTLTEIAITLSVAYVVFYVADAFLGVSAVLGVVVLGVTLSEHRTSISPEVEMFLHSFWETLAFMANTMIFHICGFIISRFVIDNAELEDCICLVMFYFGLNVIRGTTFLMFSPLLQRMGYGLTWQDGLVAAWSGLRGAVGLALTLIIFQSESDKLSSPGVGGKMMFHVSAIVVFTLLINGTTVSNLLTFLGLTDITPSRRNAMTKAVKMLDEQRMKATNVWKIDRFLADADWEMVGYISMIEDPFMSTETMEEKEIRERQGGICPQCHLVAPYIPTTTEVRYMLAEATRKYLKLLKQNFWMQFERGLLAGFSVRKLTEMAEEAADRDCEMIRVKEIKRMWRIPPKLAMARKVITRHTVAFPADSPKIVQGVWHMTLVLLGQSRLLLVAVFGTEFLFISASVALLAISMFYHPGTNLIMSIQYTTIMLVLVTAVYFLFRLAIFRLLYIKTFWFYLNLVCLMMGTAEFVLVVMDLIVWYKDLSSHQIFIFLQTDFSGIVIFISRLLRCLQICEFLAYIILDLVKHNIRNRLTKGCDIARGFVRANEVAIRLVENMSDDSYVQSKIRIKAELATMSVLRELGLLQGIHPDIALGVKTCQAVRSVLNVMREGMHHLIEEGGIDEPEGNLFVKVIESKMKRVMANPPRLLIPSPRKILEAIPWIVGNNQIVDFILSVAEKKKYQYGDIIMKIGDPADGIHFIVSGLVKVEVPLDTKSESGSQAVRLLDFVSTGNVIGEKSVMLDTPRAATLTAETIVETMFLSTEKLMVACRTFNHLEPPLEARIWKVCAVKVALKILSNMPSYRGVRQDTLLSRLDNAELVLLEEERSFTILSNMVDVILIVGVGHDSFTRDIYTGPCYIPKNVQELSFNSSQRPSPRLLYTEKAVPVAPGAKMNDSASENIRKSIIQLDTSPSSSQPQLNKLNF